MRWPLVIAGCVGLLLAAGCESSRQNQYPPTNSYQYRNSGYGSPSGYGAGMTPQSSPATNSYSTGAGAPGLSGASPTYYGGSSTPTTVTPSSSGSTSGSTQIPTNPYGGGGYGSFSGSAQ